MKMANLFCQKGALVKQPVKVDKALFDKFVDHMV